MHDSWLLGLLVVALGASVGVVGRAIRARRTPTVSVSKDDVSTLWVIVVLSVVGAALLPFALIGVAVVAFVMFAH